MGESAERPGFASDLHRWIDRAVLSRGRLPSWGVGCVLVAGFGLCYAITYALGGAGSVPASWYTPLVLAAAARFRYVGGIAAAATATLLAGPLVPRGSAERQAPTVWIGRGFVFLFVGVVTAALIDRILADRGRELRLAEQERDLAVRQAAVIATVSHEFRTPLTVITGVARTLEVHGMVTEEAEPLLMGLMDAARRLTDLVNTVGAVLDGSGDGTFVRPEPVVLRDVLDHVLDHLGIRDPRSRVSVEVDPSAEIFVCDRELLAQLLRHVVENAVKFSSDESVEISVARAYGRLEVRVRDRGPGIDEAILRSPWPFTQGDQSMTRTAQGLGLGLFAAARLASVLGGSIRFLPRRGGGTEVVVDLAAPDTSDAPTGGAARRAIA
jgi:K+-sensing histidine kinase KdpD